MTFLSNSSSRISNSVYIGDSSQILISHQLWRLFTSLFPSESLMEGLLSWYILYTFRILEQEYGSSKYVIFIILSTILGILSRLLYISTISSTVMTGIASGPYHIIYGLLPLYIRYIPSLIPAYFRIGWLKFNDKSLIYVLLIQLLLSNGLRSILPGLTGLLFGILYSIDKIYLNRLRIPLFIRLWFRRTILPYIQSIPPQQAAASGNYRSSVSSSSSSSSSNIRNNTTINNTINRRNNNSGSTTTTTTTTTRNNNNVSDNTLSEGPEPTPEAIQELMNLGFNETDVRRELRKSWGNIEVAAARLFEQ